MNDYYTPDSCANLDELADLAPIENYDSKSKIGRQMTSKKYDKRRKNMREAALVLTVIKGDKVGINHGDESDEYMNR